MEDHVSIPAELLEEAVTVLLKALGLHGEEAKIIAGTLVDADLRGVSTHGVFRLKTYAERIIAGGLNPRAKISVVREASTMAVLDADNGFGQIAAYRAAQLAVEKAGQSGAAFIGVRNSSHFGRAGYFAEWIAGHDMIGFCFSNASPRLAPWGGREKMLGNNPWSAAIPTGGEPIVLDMANSIASAGKIRRAAQAGSTIPEGWALDSEGRETTDPLEALSGVLLPFGAHKGYGITLVAGILTGVLTGGVWDSQVTPVDETGRSQQVSHLLVAVRISDFMPAEEFKEQVNRIAIEIRKCPPAEGISAVYVPGDRGHEKRSAALQGGVPLAERTFRSLNDLADRLGVSLPKGWPLPNQMQV
ncbi:Ldh family oxidoreductase [Desulfosporosinus sp. BICA1-9]|uniref:Ldh family oxidoreductase n=1 Tax=Desulfosporosinus sp. BICA1-9 TaxID=1531958 RepID=UPI00054BEDBC|nr:Ldh family oxidoreductase [Desulfosporosinus sp. BICA1-9]KJS80114.1 MAG: hypothetical protein JL57_28660 [Desulfosporosinus sp. BICA1-9]